jgi:hypothetical protein
MSSVQAVRVEVLARPAVTGTDTTWASTVIVAKGGVGGAAQAAGSTVLVQAAALAALSDREPGDLKVSGRSAARAPVTRRRSVLRVTEARARSSASAARSAQALSLAERLARLPRQTAYGSGGAGAATTTTQQAGGAGAGGLIRIWEFA